MAAATGTEELAEQKARLEVRGSCDRWCDGAWCCGVLRFDRLNGWSIDHVEWSGRRWWLRGAGGVRLGRMGLRHDPFASSPNMPPAHTLPIPYAPVQVCCRWDRTEALSRSIHDIPTYPLTQQEESDMLANEMLPQLNADKSGTLEVRLIIRVYVMYVLPGLCVRTHSIA